MSAVIMTEEYWANSHLSIARYYGGIKVNGDEYKIVNKDGVTLEELSNPRSKHYVKSGMAIQPGEPADLVRNDWIPIYRKLGRNKTIELVKNGIDLKEAKRMAKDKEYNRLIHTARWLRLRRETLTRHPLCQRCEAEGRVTPATEVHHIRPVEEAIGQAERARLMYDPHNLRALCHDCHVRTHTEMGRCGREATRKRNERQVRDVVSRFFGDGDGG